MTTMSTAAVTAAFDTFRNTHQPIRLPAFTRFPSDSDGMEDGDGLTALTDGAFASGTSPEYLQRMEHGALPAIASIWVVRQDDVVHAEKFCAFGVARAAGEVKHTNLTGGQPAFVGGELLALNDNVLIVSGDSGRYPPRSAREMNDVVQAFKDSGYTVYSMGFDEGTNTPLKFVGPRPMLV